MFVCNLFGEPVDGQSINLHCEVFRLSNYTTFAYLHKKTCSYWGLSEKNFGLFYINELDEPVDMADHRQAKVCEFLSTEYEVLRNDEQHLKITNHNFDDFGNNVG
jgi:hypothetical protein